MNRHVCSFCGQDIDEVELLFRGQIGGVPPAICGGCVEIFHEVVTAHRRSPQLAAELVAAINSRVGKTPAEGILVRGQV